MKNGNIDVFGAPTEVELQEINKYTRRKFTADELYAFSVVLCDNEIDRDFERFTDESLEKLAELFIGKTGIFDHSHKSENQCARVFSTKVETVEGRRNRIGEPYKRLFARAYMPKSAASDELILSIESGIKKEVSVGCSMSASYCSICGQPAGTCQHKKGRVYRKGGVKTLCYFDLCSPSDAYEWSFVAVPAQPAAGVVKSFANGDSIVLGDIEKSVTGGEVVLTAEEAARLSGSIESLKKTAGLAGEFLQRRKSGIVRMFMPNCTEKAEDMFLKALDRLEPDELFSLYYEGKTASDTAEVQLSTKRGKRTDSSNSFFIV